MAPHRLTTEGHVSIASRVLGAPELLKKGQNMTRNVCIALSVLACGIAPAQNRVTIHLPDSQSRSPITGQWTIVGSVILERLPLKFSTPSSNTYDFPIPLSQISGPTRSQLELGMLPGQSVFVQCDVGREAGMLRLEGHLQNGSGGGTFTFIPNPNFAGGMRSLGFAELSDQKVFMMALYDVDPMYVRELYALGVRPRYSDQLVSMGIQHVTVEYVRQFYDLGYSNLSPDTLISMRVQGVWPDFARELRDLGYGSVSPNELVSMRVQGVSTQFIKGVEALGYDHPAISQLISMRVQGVTPEYILRARSVGLGNLSIDQIINLRIHGIVE